MGFKCNISNYSQSPYLVWTSLLCNVAIKRLFICVRTTFWSHWIYMISYHVCVERDRVNWVIRAHITPYIVTCVYEPRKLCTFAATDCTRRCVHSVQAYWALSFYDKSTIKAVPLTWYYSVSDCSHVHYITLDINIYCCGVRFFKRMIFFWFTHS